MGLFDGTSLERPVTCAACGQTMDTCACPRNAAGDVTLPRDQPVRVQRERRRGTWLTIVRGLDPAATDLPAMLKACRRQYAAGGSLRDDGFELQGDHRDQLVDMLKAQGYPAKAAGG